MARRGYAPDVAARHALTPPGDQAQDCNFKPTGDGFPLLNSHHHDRLAGLDGGSEGADGAR